MVIDSIARYVVPVSASTVSRRVTPVSPDAAVGDNAQRDAQGTSHRRGANASNPWHTAVYTPPAGAEPQPLGYTRTGDILLSAPAPRFDLRA